MLLNLRRRILRAWRAYMSTDSANPYSEEFFHFTGRKMPSDDEQNYTNLLRVLDSKYVYGGGEQHRISKNLDATLATGMVVPNIACFCDIPISGLRIHTSKYGKFGLSFDRHWLAYRGARPVMYFPYRQDDATGIVGTVLLNDIETTYRTMHQFFPNASRETRLMETAASNAASAARAMKMIAFKEFLAFLKPYDSGLTTNAEEYFYAEREWRHMGDIRFEPHDVRSIVVAHGYKRKLATDRPIFSDRVHEL